MYVCLHTKLNNVLCMLKMQILPFDCGHNPATTLCNDRLIVMNNDEKFVSFSLKKDIMDGNYSGYIFNELKWNRIRLIWIAFLKNIDNKEKCQLSQCSKDVIKHIISFL